MQIWPQKSYFTLDYPLRIKIISWFFEKCNFLKSVTFEAKYTIYNLRIATSLFYLHSHRSSTIYFMPSTRPRKRAARTVSYAIDLQTNGAPGSFSSQLKLRKTRRDVGIKQPVPKMPLIKTWKACYIQDGKK